MAKARKSAGKCTCNPGYMLIALILITIGFWGIVSGFLAQFNGADAMVALPWYFVGFLLIMLGKMAKWKGCNCAKHAH